VATPIPPNQARFSVAELRSLFSVVRFPPGFDGVSGVTSDSRNVPRGALFVALAGERFDGHAFLSQAASAGARAVLAEESRLPSLELPPDVAVLSAADTLVGLGDLGRLHRRRFRGRVAAIGGSAGKTTTKSVCRALLDAARPGRVHATPGNLNNRIGVPMTLLTLGESHELSVIELGTNQQGEVRELARIVEPEVALLTLIDLEHTSGLGDIEGVAREELALYEAVSARGGTLIGNADDERLRAALRRFDAAQKIGYGEHKSAEVRVLERRVASDLRMDLLLDVLGRKVRCRTRLMGRPGALAVAAGLALLSAMHPEGIDEEAIQKAVFDAGEAGRSSLGTHASGALVLDDSYNANPASMAAGIESARELARAAGRRLTLVLGEMRELGEQSPLEHEKLGSLAAQAEPYRLLFVAGDMRLAAARARAAGISAEFFETAEEARDALRGSLTPSDLVLLKGSRGVALERVLLEDSERRSNHP